MRILAVGLAAVVVFFVARAPRRGTPPLKVYTWSNYFPESLLKEFTRRTGASVELSYMASNEELLAKLRAGATGYDIIQPSDYMVRTMRTAGLIQPLKKEKLPGLANLEDRFNKTSYDPGNAHSVPFTWGTTGIAIDTSKVKIPPGPVSWRILLDSPQPQHTSALDDMRETFAMALAFRGLDINSTQAPALESARETIAAMKSRILMFTSEPKPLLLKGELRIAHIFSCDAAQARKENSNIQYFIPAEGAVTWTDNFAIPSGSRQPDAAHAFIDFFLEPANAVAVVREKHLATPNRAARALLSAEERDDRDIYPSEQDLKRTHYLEETGTHGDLLSQLWTELKS